MVFYDVKALFPSVPVDLTISTIKSKLIQDSLLSNRNPMSILEIITSLGFCLKNTSFLFQGNYFEQIYGAAMGSLISHLIVNLLMEEFEGKAISSVLHPSKLWNRYMDDTFIIWQAEHGHQFLQHINSVGSYI